MAALTRDTGPARRGEFTRSLLASTLLFEENRRGKYHRRTESGLIELFTDVEAHRLWRPRPIAGYTLSALEAPRLLEWIIGAREEGVIVNPGSPAEVRLSCKGSAALSLFDRHVIFWI
jgi:hypothetical protein